MANISDGWLEIEPLTLEEMEAVEAALQNYSHAFNYGGAAAIEAHCSKLTIIFSGRWTCDSAWDAIDAVICEEPGKMSSNALVNARILGQGKEPGTGYRAMVKKGQGERLLKRFMKPKS